MIVLCVEALRLTVRPHFWNRRRELLRDVGFSIGDGEVTGFLGPNGAGKTTTLRVILGLIRPDAGRVEVLGGSMRDAAVRRLVGFMPERAYFPEQFTGRELVVQHALLAGLSWRAAQRQADELLERVGLRDAARRRLRDYSKGMLQRVGFAQALVGAPRLILLDEPMSGLDPLGRRDFRELIAEAKARGTTVFFSTHILPDVELLCDHVVILSAGRVLRHGSLKSLLADRVAGVEVTAGGLSPEVVATLTPRTRRARAQGGNVVFEVSDVAAANALIDIVRQQQGRVVGVDTRCPSLEDIFVEATNVVGDAR